MRRKKGVDNISVLKNDVWAMWQILIEANESFLFAKYLTKPDTENEKIFIRKSRHFQWINITLWKMCIVDLFKLYSKSDYYSVFNLCIRIRKNLYNEATIDLTVLDDIAIETRKNKRVIEDIVKMRNYRLAHKIPESVVINEIKIDEVEQLIKSTEEIIFAFYTKCFDSHPIFESLVFNSRPFDHIKKLVDGDLKYLALEEEVICLAKSNRGSK